MSEQACSYFQINLVGDPTICKNCKKAKALHNPQPKAPQSQENNQKISSLIEKFGKQTSQVVSSADNQKNQKTVQQNKNFDKMNQYLKNTNVKKEEPNKQNQSSENNEKQQKIIKENEEQNLERIVKIKEQEKIIEDMTKEIQDLKKNYEENQQKLKVWELQKLEIDTKEQNQILDINNEKYETIKEKIIKIAEEIEIIENNEENIWKYSPNDYLELHHNIKI